MAVMKLTTLAARLYGVGKSFVPSDSLSPMLIDSQTAGVNPESWDAWALDQNRLFLRESVSNTK
jgi:hypothetical protein